ncbi:MAG: phosphopantetheine-binding protein [Verrucomicrobiota bacterium]
MTTAATTIETQLKDILADHLVLGVGELASITPDTKLADLGADSFDGIELALWIEDEFDIDIEAEVELHDLTFSQIVNLVMKSADSPNRKS